MIIICFSDFIRFVVSYVANVSRKKYRRNIIANLSWFGILQIFFLNKIPKTIKNNDEIRMNLEH